MRMPAAFTATVRSRRQAIVLIGAAMGSAASGLALAQGDSLGVSLDFARAEHAAGRVKLIDIREPEEHATGVAEGAALLPMRQLASRIGELPKDPSQPVLLICNTQNRSSATARALRERGYSNVRFVQGGMSEWARRGWPMVAPRGATQTSP
jgi:rhodanese-related sulfurtransferase